MADPPIAASAKVTSASSPSPVKRISRRRTRSKAVMPIAPIPRWRGRKAAPESGCNTFPARPPPARVDPRDHWDQAWFRREPPWIERAILIISSTE